ncbi:MAG: AAA family ATPase, partial [Planctomycetota bacterium]|nr:AAA family ATPase [Planctomycetota bacterium]
MPIQLNIENYRRFRRIRWSPPKGVSLLVGPNGSGKSTLLKAFQFVSDYLGRDLEKAIDFSGGAWGLKHLGADEESPVRFRIGVDDLEWLIELKATRGERIAREQVASAGSVLLEQNAGAETFLYGAQEKQEIPVGFGSALGKVASLVPDMRRQLDHVLTPFEHYRVYENPHIWSLRKSGSPESS